MKKTRCNGEFPCTRCKDDDFLCIASTRKRTEFKKVPQGYVEVLESTQHALVATIQKLYAVIPDKALGS
ncbi:hypothetical protein OCU04_013056 [Sclerotinia nivalis]|uniref:Zn(2)-C6 fungal-type domain-containing protein n=1 Tax=Sclerotinia nivalis TaxID=352851 RepID=A0A9X0DDS4_9HELO|nr:hypothetical protein OCU04_013056 [Sclerotinia nivalis]